MQGKIRAPNMFHKEKHRSFAQCICITVYNDQVSERHWHHRNEETTGASHQNSEGKLFPATQTILNTDNPSSWIRVKTFLDRHKLKNIPPMQEEIEDRLQQYKSISQKEK